MTENCDVCGKELDEECVKKHGKKFCCNNCKNHHEDPKKPDTKENVCEFC